MEDAFPTTPRASTAVRVRATVLGLAAILLATRTTVTSSAWVGKPFPGFMILDNRVVASIGLAHWPGASVPGLYQSEVVAVDGRPIASASAAYAYVASLPVGTPVRYLVRRQGREAEVVIPTQRFDLRDWTLLFGAFLLCGFTYMTSGLIVWLARPGPIGRAFVAFGITWAVFLLTAMSLYGPATFFRVHAASESLLAPAMLQLTSLFPEPRRWARWRFAGYVPALVLLVFYEIYLNATLEQRVADRTAQLESTNHDLVAALTDLRHTQVQLVQSEKMASLGRLVAGVAHEINNPVSFIATSVTPLRRRLERAASAAPADVRRWLDEADEIIGVMARGAERTTAIVHDLRSFSRLGEATRKPVDLHDGRDTTLRLLESRWRGHITVHREYADLPLVECHPGQMNQVFMNVLANACDAVLDGGNIWITTRCDGDAVEVVIRDDGPGIAPEVRDHIFDPFFTTKEVGHGTGLGLAISHQVVTAHGGSIGVESTPGAGATVRICIPAGQTRSLDTVASAGG
jgi:signal transduction histidine kinase